MLLPFGSMVDRRKRLHRDVVDEISSGAHSLLPTLIPNSSVVERMGVERAPVAAFAPNTTAATAFRSLWTDVAGRLWRD